MVATESPLNSVRGPAKQPGWAQLVRLGGDRVAILFDELRKAVGRMDGVVERLQYSGREERWFVQYRVGGAELFAVRISPGLLEGEVPLNGADLERLMRLHNLSRTVKDAIGVGTTKPWQGSVRLPLKDRRGVRSFVRLARAKNSLISNAREAIHKFPLEILEQRQPKDE